MWYNTIPDINFSAWLSDALDLFTYTYEAIMGFPPLGFFLGTLLFLATVDLLAYLLRQGRKSKL